MMKSPHKKAAVNLAVAVSQAGCLHVWRAIPCKSAQHSMAQYCKVKQQYSTAKGSAPKRPEKPTASWVCMPSVTAVAL